LHKVSPSKKNLEYLNGAIESRAVTCSLVSQALYDKRRLMVASSCLHVMDALQ